jgi:geranylgeranyl pyrophosphate synthase
MEERFPDYCHALRPRLDAAVGEALDGLFRHPPPGGLKVDELFRGGKMLRGCLVCLVAESFGAGLDAALPRSVAVELIHGATLIHDDFVDQDRTRRHRPAAWTLAGARRAVLLGDLIFASAIAMMGELGREDGVSVSRAIARLAQGAFQEPVDAGALARHLVVETVSEDFYDRVIDLKTGVLFATACQLGAIAAGAGPAAQGASYRYGGRIGEAYQIADDQMDIETALASGKLEIMKLAGLAPALLRFGEGWQTRLPGFLAREELALRGPLVRELEALHAAMAEERDRRLALARQEAASLGAGSPGSGMLASAPQQIVGMLAQS